ncbi:MAG: hypothetical protein AAGD13_00625 [Pseudomonadota bacterium]
MAKILIAFNKTCAPYHSGDLAGFDPTVPADLRMLRQIAADRAGVPVKVSKAGKATPIGVLASDGSVEKATAAPAAKPTEPAPTEAGSGAAGPTDAGAGGDGSLAMPGVS